MLPESSLDPGVVVVGMHRSGTSGVTRVLRELGGRMPSDNLTDATAFNARGNHEVRELTAANDRILRLIGGWWDAPPPNPDWEAVRSSARVARFRSRLEALHPGRGWVWKDPRLCITLPAWDPALPRETRYVWCLRRPADVVSSLSRRNRFSNPHGLALWEHYNRSAAHNLAGRPTFVVVIDDMRSRPEKTLEALRLFVSPVVDVVDSSTAIHAFEPGLMQAGNTLSRPLELSQDQLYDELCRLRGAHDSLAVAVAPPTEWATELLSERNRRRNAERSIERRTLAGLGRRAKSLSSVWYERAKRLPASRHRS